MGSVRQRKGCAVRQPRPALLRYLPASLPPLLPLAPIGAVSRKHMGLGPLTLAPPCPLLPLGSRSAWRGVFLNPLPATGEAGADRPIPGCPVPNPCLPDQWGKISDPWKKKQDLFPPSGPAALGLFTGLGLQGEARHPPSRDAFPAECTSSPHSSPATLLVALPGPPGRRGTRAGGAGSVCLQMPSVRHGVLG